MAGNDILIGEVNKQTCIALKQYCVNMGCFGNIVFAQDGVIASNKLQNQKFDIIILDLNLPKRSGVEILKEISKEKRPLNPITNIIAISDAFEKQTLEKIVSYGVKYFLVKPIEEAIFQEKVLKVLKSKIANK